MFGDIDTSREEKFEIVYYKLIPYLMKMKIRNGEMIPENEPIVRFLLENLSKHKLRDELHHLLDPQAEAVIIDGNIYCDGIMELAELYIDLRDPEKYTPE